MSLLAVLKRNDSRAAGTGPFFARRHAPALCLLFLVAFLARLQGVDRPPLDFHATRQYRSLLMARGYYFESLESLPRWRLEVAAINKERQGVLEPPIMESLVALGYRLVGGEHFWVSRLLSSLFWLTGGVFLYRIARRMTFADGALFSLAFYLLSPFATVASRSFQPDPLMVMMLLFSLLTILRYYDRPSALNLLAAGTVAALAGLIKPVSLFVILGAFVSLAVYGQGLRAALLSARPPVFALLALLPAAAFYLYGVFVAGFLRDQAQASFLPQFLLSPLFWQSWANQIGAVVGFAAFGMALLGTLTLRAGPPRALMFGLWAGYAAFVLTFDYPAAAHDYYHLQLIPIVALGAGVVFARLLAVAGEARLRAVWRLAIWSILLVALLLDAGVRLPLSGGSNAAREIARAREIGEIVGHSARTVFLSDSYGLPLEYHGELSGMPWPIRADLDWEELAGLRPLGAKERFSAWFSSYAPEYFIVEDLRDFEGQADLKGFLLGKFSVVAAPGDYLVFDLRREAASEREGR